MEARFKFEESAVQTATSQEVRRALDDGHGVAVYGPPGTGKTHAVRMAVNGAAWTLIPDQPFAVPRVIADLAEQLGGDDAPTRAYAEGGCRAACEELDRRLGDRVLVIDAADWLWMRADDPIVPDASTVWEEEFADLADWIKRRLATRPTVVISRRQLQIAGVALRHDGLPSWPVELTWSEEGFLSWRDVVDHVGGNPAALQLAAALLRLAGLPRMQLWLDTATDSVEARGELGSLLRRHAPRSLLRVLSLLQAAGELSRDLLDELDDEAETNDDLAVGLELASSLHLVEERSGIVRPMPFLGLVGAVPPLAGAGAETLVRDVIGSILRRINDRSSLRPADARAVLDAHRLQLAAGDLDGALTTARLHLGGLIMHARRLSLEAERPEEFDEARRAYASILQLMTTERRHGQGRARAYVLHYHGFNGYRAKTLGLDRVAADYRESTDGWRENALFHARRIALEVERGDVAHARTLLEAAYSSVPEHPRRDAVLRVRPAGWAFRARAPVFALELLENGPSPDALIDIDPEAYQVLLRLRRIWGGTGLEVDRLTTADGRQITFRGPVRLRVCEAVPGWEAESDYPPARAWGPGPWSAVQAIAASMADECVRLCSQPTGRLARHDVGTKGLYLGAIDLSLSDLGLPHQPWRWLVGKVERGTFVCATEDLGTLNIADGLAPEPSEGMFFGRVAVDRGGVAAGSIDRLVPAGSGRTMTDLFAALRKVANGDDDAA